MIMDKNHVVVSEIALLFVDMRKFKYVSHFHVQNLVIFDFLSTFPNLLLLFCSTLTRCSSKNIRVLNYLIEMVVTLNNLRLIWNLVPLYPSLLVAKILYNCRHQFPFWTNN